MTEKQWHRSLIGHISNIIADNTTPQDISFIECGVKQGSSSVIMAKNLRCPGYLFDTWTGIPNFSKIDAPTEGKARRIKKRMHTKSTKKDCINNLKDNNVDHLCTLVEGDACVTIPYVKLENPISMMHLDTDVSAPIKFALNYFWQDVINAGVIVIHDYADKRWRGVKAVVDEFVEAHEDINNLYVCDPEKLRAAVIVKGSNTDIHNYLTTVMLT